MTQPEFGQFWAMRVGNGGKSGTQSNEVSITYRPVKPLQPSNPTLTASSKINNLQPLDRFSGQ